MRKRSPIHAGRGVDRFALASRRRGVRPGHRSGTRIVAYFALDTGDATVETISVFHDKAAADASNELASITCARTSVSSSSTRTAVSGEEVLVSRVTAEALDAAHRWRTDRARLRAS